MKVQTGCWDCPEERGQAAAGRKIPMNTKEWQLKPLRREKDYSRKVYPWTRMAAETPKERERRLQQSLGGMETTSKKAWLHTWENSDPTPVCTLISTIDIWGDSAELWMGWSHRKPTKYTCSYELRYWTLIQPFRPPPNHWRSCCLQQ